MTIYNAFLFMNEFDLLEIRLNELDSIVDYFILSESPTTHSGLSKPLYYQDHKNEERFKKFEHKIIHQIITDTPLNYLNLHTDPANDELLNIVIEKVNNGNWWPHDREDYGRITFETESLLRAMKNCKPNDILILNEADEIPRREVVEYVIENFNPEQIYNLQHTFYYYYFNCLKDESWFGSIILTFEKFKNLSLCEMKMRRRGVSVSNAGWHFSYLGNLNAIKYKIESQADVGLNTQHMRANMADNIENCFINGRDIYFRPAKFTKTIIDETYPKYIFENQEKFAKYIAK
jgi:beta-1,4-mannosyl-glycoprotein beta-1,4-N-acetylglucosaminyltransferase